MSLTKTAIQFKAKYLNPFHILKRSKDIKGIKQGLGVKSKDTLLNIMGAKIDGVSANEPLLKYFQKRLHGLRGYNARLTKEKDLLRNIGIAEALGTVGLGGTGAGLYDHYRERPWHEKLKDKLV